MGSLYDEKGNWIPEALEICNEINNLLFPILEKTLSKGMSHSDFCYMVNTEVEALILADRRHKKMANKHIKE